MMDPKEYDAKILAVLEYYEPDIIAAANRRDFDSFDTLRQSRDTALRSVAMECFGRIA